MPISARVGAPPMWFDFSRGPTGPCIGDLRQLLEESRRRSTPPPAKWQRVVVDAAPAIAIRFVSPIILPHGVGAVHQQSLRSWLVNLGACSFGGRSTLTPRTSDHGQSPVTQISLARPA